MALQNFPVQRDLFTAVGHLGMRRHAEDSLTNAFQACFTYSAVFQQTVLDKLWSVCGLRRNPPINIKWKCATQISDQDSRYDIYITAEGARSHRTRLPVFIIENKLAAPLTEPQLDKYSKKERDFDHCIAVITRDHPEVPLRRLSENGIAALRWQDLYRALEHASDKGSKVDKFLIIQFLQYLSRANMAYESVSLRDIQHFGRLLSAISQGRRDGVVNRGRKAFSTGDAVLRLLKEVQLIVKEHLNSSLRLNTWGPGYDRYEDEAGSVWHYLYFSFYKGIRSINCGISISDDAKEEVYLEIDCWDDKKKAYYTKPNCCLPVARFMSDAMLDKDKISSKCKDLFQRWGVAKSTIGKRHY